MTAALAAVAPLREGFSSAEDEVAWTLWLREQLTPGWRPAEWDEEVWLFTGDLDSPATSVWVCSTSACGTSNPARNMRCSACENQFKVSELTAERFAQTYVPAQQGRNGVAREPCLVAQNGARCGREQKSAELCTNHYSSWWSRVLNTRPRASAPPAAEWALSAQPYPIPDRCLVLGCSLEQLIQAPLCRIHQQRWLACVTAGTTGADISAWARRQAPYLSLGQFSLAPLHPTVRWELLYALQQRDLQGKALEPVAMRAYVRLLADTHSVLLSSAGAASLNSLNARSLLTGLRREVRLGLDRFRGIAPADKRIWDLAAVGLTSTFRTGSRRRPGEADFTRIRQPWLQDAVWHWARATRPTDVDFSTSFKACLTAATALDLRPGGRIDPAALGLADMDAIVTAFRELRTADGSRLLSASHRPARMAGLFVVLDFARRAGLLEAVPGTFARHRSHRIAVEERNEDEIGKAIPESVIAQLDAHMDLLGEGFTYGEMAADDAAWMSRTIYILLRDTGRRPGEIASLDLNCLEYLDGDYNLIWHNRKTKRRRRRLTITASTVAAIQAWQIRLRQLPVPASARAFLFPPITADSGYPHISTGSIWRAIRTWADGITVLHSELPDIKGTPLPFDRSLIYPYAFRHSYAQRHADAGTDLDVLRALMDHTDLKTTQRYYQVSQRRKREAVTRMRQHVVNRTGRPAPMASNVAYEARSVAVPWGNCVEPQNVKAGGKGCRIRFQCAGCGFYRPDPSHLPAIEAHVHALKSDRETATAMDADTWIIQNLTDQVTAFKDVADTMLRRMDELPDEERAEIAEAASVLRKARAATGRNLIPLSVVRHDRNESSQ